MKLSKIDYKDEYVVQKISSTIKDIINENTVIVCIGTDRVIGDSLGPLIGTILERNKFKYPVYGTLEKPIHALNIYESIENIEKTHPNGIFLVIDACVGEKTSVGTIQIMKGPVSPGKGSGKKLPQIGHYSLLGIVDEKCEDRNFLFGSVRLNFIFDLAEIISSSLLASTLIEK